MAFSLSSDNGTRGIDWSSPTGKKYDGENYNICPTVYRLRRLACLIGQGNEKLSGAITSYKCQSAISLQTLGLNCMWMVFYFSWEMEYDVTMVLCQNGTLSKISLLLSPGLMGYHGLSVKVLVFCYPRWQFCSAVQYDCFCILCLVFCSLNSFFLLTMPNKNKQCS